MDEEVYDLRDIEDLWKWAMVAEEHHGYLAAEPILHNIEQLEWQKLDELTRPDAM